jgi:hypothetical protein
VAAHAEGGVEERQRVIGGRVKDGARFVAGGKVAGETAIGESGPIHRAGP